MYDDKFDKVTKISCFSFHLDSKNEEHVQMYTQTTEDVFHVKWKWNISKCPVFTSRKIHQQILVSFPRQVVNTIFIHGVTTFDKGTLGLRLC